MGPPASIRAARDAKARIDKAIELADAAVKQLITLATAVIGGAIVFFRDVDQPGVEFGPHYIRVSIGLLLMVLSAALGMLAVNNFAGILEKPPPGGPTIYKGSIRLFWCGQIVCFLLGLVFLISAAFPLPERDPGPVAPLTLPPNQELDCGSPADRSVQVFNALEPLGADRRGWIEGDSMVRQLDLLAKTLQNRANNQKKPRKLAALLLIGSTDRRRISEHRKGKPHRDNAALAYARAAAVRDALVERLGIFAPPILILNGRDIPITRLVLADLEKPASKPSESETGRQVHVCAIWFH